ncbi:MAG: bifunctional adenosylcobinamide kinase/adenosylcobinamide-phosphate guanylyltransferase, partial [Chloroflexi bacterium]|nr:bifunctional adenosylcobinamide kinase/adenosylcobinamide-phosphate guanylyltransferase [Chloroflexota bacterium]
ILGGARSGKSDFAQSLAKRAGGSDVLFLATAEALDDEMTARIDKHRQSRPPEWATLPAPRAPGRALRSAHVARVVLLDCVTLWVSNVLLADGIDSQESMVAELRELLDWHRDADADLIVVSNEVGMSIVPDNPLGREFRDLVGMVNKRLAQSADAVYLIVAGLPMELKRMHFPGEET